MKRAEHRHWTFDLGYGVYHADEIKTDKLTVEVYQSPTGRSQRVFVNGHEFVAPTEEASDD